MRKSYLCLLTVAMVIASIIIVGCTTSNQPNQVSSSETTNASTTTTTTTTASSSVASASPTVTPSPSASPTAATPTPASGKIATSIALGVGSSGPPQLHFTKGESINWVIDVTSSEGQVHGGGVTVSIPGTSAGQVTYESSFHSAYFTLNGGLPPGTYAVTLRYAGDSTHKPSETTFNINVT